MGSRNRSVGRPLRICHLQFLDALTPARPLQIYFLLEVRHTTQAGARVRLVMASQSPHPGDPQVQGPSSGLSLKVLLALIVILVIAGGVALLTTAGGNSSHPSGGIAHGVASSRFSGSLASPAQPEPPLHLRNYKGEPVNIGQFRGKAVFVTFLYTKCPDVCPIIASNLGVALNLMGSAKASRVQVVAVSVDPRGDTPKAVGGFLQRHGMSGRMQYLIGSTHELARAWQAWGVGSEQDAQQPQLVNHTGIVYGVSASGKVTTVYAANLTPQEIVHDAPLLASS